MPAIERGRVCLLMKGRKTGKKAIIAEVENNNTVIVIVDGKEKRYNMRHLFPTSKIAEVPSIKKTQSEKEEKEK